MKLRNQRTSWIARVAFGLICLGTAAFGQATQPKNPLGTGPEVVAAGHAIFNRTCTACHGIDGGEGERAPALVGERRFFRLSPNAIYDVVKNGIPGTAMPAMGLPDDDIWRIVTFIRAMRGSASETDVPGNVQRGAAVFAGKGGCLQCHMLNGKGGSAGPDLSNVGAQVTLKHLRESLTQELPIPPAYRPVTVITRSGETITGIAKNEDGFSLQMLDLHDRLHLFDKTELKSVEHGKKSLMPHNYDKVLTAEEYQDLVAMLAHQVQVELHKKAEGEGEAGR
ncbi:c-type cytochrome [Granulicella sp. WH15]|uniref:c-type cytochrome n=1 Tax=Granulicella sp. WH15 TaxID=2602070 RepID=UPI0013670878|nr:c-type cytochrome [Granulicella sp. WH15]QHN04575.1 c-type cytochrome [Granulicella sp. WH15]